MDQELFNPQSSSVTSSRILIHTVHVCADIVTASAGGRIVAGHPSAYIDENEPDLVSMLRGSVRERNPHLRRNDL